MPFAKSLYYGSTSSVKLRSTDDGSKLLESSVGLYIVIHLSPCFLTVHWYSKWPDWCAWDHAVCMCMGTPRTDWHVPMCIDVESGYLPFIVAFILLYCGQYSSYCIVVLVYLYTYSIPICIFCAFLIIFIHSITTVTFHHMSTPAGHHTLLIQSECFVQPFTDEGGCIVTKTSELLCDVG